MQSIVLCNNNYLMQSYKIYSNKQGRMLSFLKNTRYYNLFL